MTTFELPREATIQFSDVFGTLPLDGRHQAGLVDFDAALTAQVRNTGHFVDQEFPIGAWPATGEYGAVLVAQLRQEQAERASDLLGIDDPSSVTAEELKQLHPDDAALIHSLQQVVVGIVNSAPRTTEHHETSKNGSEFYVGTTGHNFEAYAQLDFFRGLAARGLLRTLHRIPNDGGVWRPGEQFRSSWVSQARRDPSVLEEVAISDVPEITQAGRVSWIDKFGNVRLEVPDLSQIRELLDANEDLNLTVAGVGSLAVQSVRSLVEIKPGALGVYVNPTEVGTAHGPGYVELAKRVDDPNTSTGNAYNALVELVGGDGPEFNPNLWETTDLQLVASRG